MVQPNPQQHAIVETIRGLLRLNQTKGDIARMIVSNKNFGLNSTKAVGKYIALARKRNRESIGRTADEALADSISYWSDKQREALQTIQRCNEDIVYHRDRIKNCEVTIDDPASLKERVEISRELLLRSVQLMDDARRTKYTSEKTSMECQDRIDRLLGNFAPVKVANTDSKGKDVPAQAIQPATVQEATNRVTGLLEQLKARSSGETN